MKNSKLCSQKGLTAFELVFVLCLLGVLGLVHHFALDSLSGEFRESFEKYTVSAVQIGILSYWVDPKRGDLKKYPPFLDSASNGSCEGKRLCFDNVLAGGVTGMWMKKSSLEYKGPSRQRHLWKYNPVAGQILIMKE